jgi:O-methyltransferase
LRLMRAIDRVVQSFRLRREAARVSSTARRVRRESLSYLNFPELADIERCAREAPDGDFLECGIALGGSAILMASLLPRERVMHGYDVFGMIPPPGPEDPPRVHARYQVIASGQSAGIGGETYYGYRDNLYDEVVDSFARFGHPVGERVKLYRGLFEFTLYPDFPIALAHIDCDWYAPVKLCLERIWPRLLPGAFVVCDDYHSHDGARKAVDEFLAQRPQLRDAGFGSGHLVLRRDR